MSEGKGRIMLVTGASSGIGAATARLAAEQGWTVGLVARRQERLEEVLGECRSYAPASRMWVADLGDLDTAGRIALEAWDAFDGIDAVVNNAGIPKRRSSLRLDIAEVENVMRVNFLSPVRITLALLRLMVERGTGVIVNVSSLAGRIGVTTEAAYSASKFALAGWSEALAADLHGTGVQVRLALPGTIDTEIWDQPDNDPPLYHGPLTPARDMAEAILASVDSDRFEHYLPDMKQVVEMKTADLDGFLQAMVTTTEQWKEEG